MTILLLLAPISVLLGLAAVVAFVWTLRSGQYDDIRGSAERILMDDDGPLPTPPDPEQQGPGASHAGGADTFGPRRETHPAEAGLAMHAGRFSAAQNDDTIP